MNDTEQDREAALALVADGVSLHQLDRERIVLSRTINNGACEDEAEAGRIMDRLSVLEWGIAEAPAHTPQDMAVKVRLWERSIEDGTAAWDYRLAETLLEALGK